MVVMLPVPAAQLAGVCGEEERRRQADALTCHSPFLGVAFQCASTSTVFADSLWTVDSQSAVVLLQLRRLQTRACCSNLSWHGSLDAVVQPVTGSTFNKCTRAPLCASQPQERLCLQWQKAAGLRGPGAFDATAISELCMVGFPVAMQEGGWK